MHHQSPTQQCLWVALACFLWLAAAPGIGCTARSQRLIQGAQQSTPLPLSAVATWAVGKSLTDLEARFGAAIKAGPDTSTWDHRFLAGADPETKAMYSLAVRTDPRGVVLEAELQPLPTFPPT